jgi:hypothetical protein
MNNGFPPTALKARTGEFTPPGMTLRARWNKLFSDISCIFEFFIQNYCGLANSSFEFILEEVVFAHEDVQKN